MRTPKSLLKLQSVFVPLGTVEIVTFRSNGLMQTGFAVVDQDKNELLVCEPVCYSNGDRWLVKNYCTSNWRYEKTLRGLVANVAPMHTGYKFGTVELTRKPYISETSNNQ